MWLHLEERSEGIEAQSHEPTATASSIDDYGRRQLQTPAPRTRNRQIQLLLMTIAVAVKPVGVRFLTEKDDDSGVRPPRTWTLSTV